MPVMIDTGMDILGGPIQIIPFLEQIAPAHVQRPKYREIPIIARFPDHLRFLTKSLRLMKLSPKFGERRQETQRIYIGENVAHLTIELDGFHPGTLGVIQFP